jgi:hypothetical protein
MLMHSVAASGIPGSEYGRLKPLDRPNGKLVSNAEWASPIDPDAKITRIDYDDTRLVYQPENAVDHVTGAIGRAEAGCGRSWRS